MKGRQFSEIKYKGKNAFELTEEMKNAFIHERNPDHVTTFSCNKHSCLCILVWCKNHQLYEHGVEGFE